MYFYKYYFKKFYLFTTELTEHNKKKIIKIKNLSVVIDEIVDNKNIEKILDIINFCRKNKIKIYLKNQLNLSIKLNLNGILITGDMKNHLISRNIYNNKKKFEILGIAHSQYEYFIKKKQNCYNIFLSPIFFNKKYSHNKILGISKFNLISKNWNCNLIALGGINYSNIQKILLTKSQGIGFKNFINDL